MSESLYVRLSSPLLTRLDTNQGPRRLAGTHALAGVELRPGDPNGPDQPPTLEAAARFWLALGQGLENGAGAWLTSYELRLGRPAGGALRAALCAKTFAPQDEAADQAAAELAEALAWLYPLPAQTRRIASAAQFDELWGSGQPLWQVELRPGLPFGQRGPVSLAALAGAWAQMTVFPGPLWLSLGLCPTRVFPGEAVPFDGLERDDELIWLLRLRIAGAYAQTRWAAQTWLAALTGSRSLPPAAWGAPRLCIPQTLEEEQAAAFNWDWADWQPWGANTAGKALVRSDQFFYLAEIGELAGLWPAAFWPATNPAVEEMP